MDSKKEDPIRALHQEIQKFVQEKIQSLFDQRVEPWMIGWVLTNLKLDLLTMQVALLKNNNVPDTQIYSILEAETSLHEQCFKAADEALKLMEKSH